MAKSVSEWVSYSCRPGLHSVVLGIIEETQLHDH